MENKVPKTYKLNATTLGYIDMLSSGIGTTSTAVIEMAVATLYRQWFGAEGLMNQPAVAKPTNKRSSFVEDEPDVETSASVREESSGEAPAGQMTFRERREFLGLTRTALAEAAGISEGTVRRFEAGSESGKYKPHLVTAEMLAKVAKGLQWSEQETARVLGAKRFLI